MPFMRYVRHSSPYAVWFIFVMLCGSSPSAMASVGHGDSPVFRIGSGEYGTGIGDSAVFSLSHDRMTLGHGDSGAFEVLAAVADAKATRQNDPGQTVFVESDYGYESRGATSYKIQLDGTDSLLASTFSWQQLDVPASTPPGDDPVVTLDNPASPTPTFDALQWDGSTELTKTEARLRFQLTINAGDTLGERTDEVEVHIRLPGDANGDDRINAFDVMMLRTSAPDADFNGDGTVNGADLSILRLNSHRRRTVE